jgi:hypothetical protein
MYHGHGRKRHWRSNVVLFDEELFGKDVRMGACITNASGNLQSVIPNGVLVVLMNGIQISG